MAAFTNRLLLAGVASVALITSAQAELSIVRTWSNPDEPIHVTQWYSPISEHGICAFPLSDPASKTVFVLEKRDDSVDRIEIWPGDGMKFTSGGWVSFSIDGVLHSYPMELTEDGVAYIFRETGDELDFLHDLFNGQILTVNAENVRAGFSLAGSANAIALQNRCRDSIVANAAQRSGAPTQPYAAGLSSPAPQQQYAQPQPVEGEAMLVANDVGTFDVSALLNGSAPMTFTLDTGATGLNIPRSVADQLMREGRLAPTDFRRLITSVLADNRKIVEALYILHSVTIAGRTVYDVPCIVGDDDQMMLLGQAVLKKFRSWSIDNERHVLVLN